MISMETVTARLNAIRTDSISNSEDEWPATQLAALSEFDLWGTAVPPQYGGSIFTPKMRLSLYEAVAGVDVSVALILTQHDGACGLLANCENQRAAEPVLKGCAQGDILATVGISQLTTSRQGKGPSLRAAAVGDAYVLDGTMPWVTSARKADHIVTGAVLEDGRQILACLPTNLPDMVIDPPMQLMGLASSWTSAVHCQGTKVAGEHLLKKPAAKALERRSPAKPLTVSAVGIGMAGTLLNCVLERRDSLPDARELIDHEIQPRYESLRHQLYLAADGLDKPEEEVSATEIRVAINDLISRLALTVTTIGKGSAYLSTSPLQRLVREAMFFLVWSAQTEIQLGTLRKLWL